jgi:hypothetical protein
MLTNAQYALRTEGDFDYRFDNDFLWDAGPGAYLFLTDEFSLALRGYVSGEHKGQDTFRGNHVDGSQISNIFVGPQLLIFTGSGISGEFSIDIPFDDNGIAGTVQADYRIRTAIGYRF